MSHIKDTSAEILRPDPSLADNVATYPSPTFAGKSAAVAEKGGNQVCWNCFTILGKNFTDLVMGNAIVRFCDARKCHVAVAKQNNKRAALENAGRIVPIIREG